MDPWDPGREKKIGTYREIEESVYNIEKGAICTLSLAPDLWDRKEDRIYRDTLKADDSRDLQREMHQWNRAVDTTLQQLVSDSSPSVCHIPL